MKRIILILIDRSLRLLCHFNEKLCVNEMDRAALFESGALSCALVSFNSHWF